MAPGFTQTVTEMSTEEFWGKMLLACKVDSLTTIYESIIWTTWDPHNLSIPRPPWPVTGIALHSFVLY
jgi:hypothetical protein